MLIVSQMKRCNMLGITYGRNHNISVSTSTGSSRMFHNTISCMQIFNSKDDHRTSLMQYADLPKGFRSSSVEIDFSPKEVPSLDCKMMQTLIALDEPTENFAGVFTKNLFPGAPVIIGKERMNEEKIQAVLINTKVANVCPDGGGVADSEILCFSTAMSLGYDSPTHVVPCSTGVIGWKLPIDEMLEKNGELTRTLSKDINGLDIATNIMTTDLYPKLRSIRMPNGGRILGIAKGAGMIEPNMATMLVYILTDIAVPRKMLRQMLSDVVDESFNCISVDGDTSTSDTVLALSSNKYPMGTGREGPQRFEQGLRIICSALAEDIVRNGEGVKHVIRVNVQGAPSYTAAKGVGKSVVNSPLVKSAIAGNDPNVGRIIAAVGKYLGEHYPTASMDKFKLYIAGDCIFEDGKFNLNKEVESKLQKHLKRAQMYSSQPIEVDGQIVYRPPFEYPPHHKYVDIAMDLGLGGASADIVGGDLTHEYISENADYRS